MVLTENDWQFIGIELKRMAAYIKKGQSSLISEVIRRAMKTGQIYSFDKMRDYLDGLPGAAFYSSLAALSPEKRRAFVIGYYMCPGLPNSAHNASERIIRKLPWAGVNDLPEELRGREYITVYRAGCDPLGQTRRRLSWALSLETVEHYINGDVIRSAGTEATTIYRGKLRPRDVIAYLSDNDELLQYMAVYDVEIYTP